MLQKIADDPITECEECGAPATRVLHPVAIHFKGSGFYSTDYGRGSRKKEPSTDGGGGGDSDSGSKKDSDKKSETKPAEA